MVVNKNQLAHSNFPHQGQPAAIALPLGSRHSGGQQQSVLLVHLPLLHPVVHCHLVTTAGIALFGNKQDGIGTLTINKRPELIGIPQNTAVIFGKITADGPHRMGQMVFFIGRKFHRGTGQGCYIHNQRQIVLAFRYIEKHIVSAFTVMIGENSGIIIGMPNHIGRRHYGCQLIGSLTHSNAVITSGQTAVCAIIGNIQRQPIQVFLQLSDLICCFCTIQTIDRIKGQRSFCVCSRKKLNLYVLRRAGLSESKKVNSVTKEERERLVRTVKDLTFSFLSVGPFEEAVVTSGGVELKELTPRCESRLVPGLYFIGEVTDADAYTGGYNLQIAFSTAAACARDIAEKAEKEKA